MHCHLGGCGYKAWVDIAWAHTYEYTELGWTHVYTELGCTLYTWVDQDKCSTLERPHSRANCILPHPLNPLTVLIEVTHVKGETLVDWEPILPTEVFFNSILTTRETDLKEACLKN